MGQEPTIGQGLVHERRPPLALVDQLVEASARSHGHLCPGQVIGVRMSILGLGRLGHACPLGWPEIKDLLGIVEIERCLADAVATATGLRFGRGSLKLINLGLLAVTFLDLPSGRAVRVVSRDQARGLAAQYAPGAATPQAAQVAAYRAMPDDELFDLQWVRVNLPPQEMPGVRPPKVPCQGCGVLVRSGQVHSQDGRSLCAVCAGQTYFSMLDQPARTP
ncbi:MAG: formylmethanofuran dehydrogenase [Desulfarculus sp.]|nr:formylmethanofuran dehydrogenase [Desulfarculus sp.]